MGQVEQANESIIETGTVCFRIDGEWLTDFCRDLVTEGRWRHALHTLTTGVRDFGHDNAIAVLRGEMKLVGTNDLELVAEDRIEKRDAYLELVAWQYAGCWKRPDGLWQPYAEVTSFGRMDMPRDIPMYVHGTASMNPRYAAARVLYYADDPSDRVFEVSDGAQKYDRVLWKLIPDPPLWVEGCRTYAAALTQYKELRRGLEERGSAGSGSLADFAEVDPEFAEQVEDLDELTRHREAWNRASAEVPSMSPLESMAFEQFGTKGLEAISAMMGTQQDENEPPERDPELLSDGGYILTDGRFYGCGYMGHPELALRLLKHVFNVEAPKDPEKEADKRNWLRIQPSALRQGEYAIMSPKDRPTKAQERTLADWCIAHQHPYPESLRR